MNGGLNSRRLARNDLDLTSLSQSSKEKPRIEKARGTQRKQTQGRQLIGLAGAQMSERR